MKCEICGFPRAVLRTQRKTHEDRESRKTATIMTEMRLPILFDGNGNFTNYVPKAPSVFVNRIGIGGILLLFSLSHFEAAPRKDKR